MPVSPIADPREDSPISLVHVSERTASTVSSWPSRERREPRERLSACRPARISNKGKLDSFVESDEGPVDRVVQFQETYGPQRHRMCSNLPTESKSYWRFKSDQRSTLSREPGAWLPAPSGTETPPLSFHQGARLLLRPRELEAPRDSSSPALSLSQIAGAAGNGDPDPSASI